MISYPDLSTILSETVWLLPRHLQHAGCSHDGSLILRPDFTTDKLLITTFTTDKLLITTFTTDKLLITTDKLLAMEVALAAKGYKQEQLISES
jgi:hypothetical protein